jgi:DNA-binding transcriptional ArsR family regulator
MLEQIFGSKTRAKLLRLFLERPSDLFYVRNLSRLIKEHLNSVRRELANLENMGLLVSLERDGKKYYSVDTAFPIFNELRSLILKSHLLVERLIVKKLQRLDGIKYLALTGKFVDDLALPTDMLIIGRVSKDNLSKFIKEIEKGYDRDLRYTYLTMAEFQDRKAMTDKFLYSILQGKKIVLLDHLPEVKL